MENNYPLVTFGLMTYNQQDTIREAMKGALEQKYQPLEIIISDDCSSDRTFEIIEEMASDYGGPHKIILNRNEKNLGIGRHFNVLIELASGEIFEMAAGDDISLPDRTTETVRIFKEHPDLFAVSLSIQHFENECNIDRNMSVNRSSLTFYDIKDFIKSEYIMNAPARAFRKYAHQDFGPLDDECPIEDGPNILRCLLHGRVASASSVGVFYRWNGRNISAPENIQKIDFSKIFKEYNCTIEAAFNKNLIDEPNYIKLMKKTADRLSRWNAIKKINDKNFPLLTRINVAMKAKGFTVRERLGMIFAIFYGNKLKF